MNPDYPDHPVGDVECPFCWDTGWILVMEPDPTSGDGREARRPCPEGCPVPGEVPFR